MAPSKFLPRALLDLYLAYVRGSSCANSCPVSKSCLLWLALSSRCSGSTRCLMSSVVIQRNNENATRSTLSQICSTTREMHRQMKVKYGCYVAFGIHEVPGGEHCGINCRNVGRGRQIQGIFGLYLGNITD